MVSFDVLAQAAALAFTWEVLLVVLCAGAFGMFVGAMPGLTATMATALLVPVTFFMEPIPAVAAIVTASGMAIFAGDIPGALLRMPGTPASAAYVEDSHRLALEGKLNLSLGTSLIVSCLGGLFGVAVLILAAPLLAEFALKFTSFEYFWLAALGLSCAIFIASDNPLKAGVSLLIGLSLATIGLDPASGTPRFTFGSTDLLAGIEFVPAMIGLFAMAEILRGAIRLKGASPLPQVPSTGGRLFAGVGGIIKRYPLNILRSSTLGTFIGALPGAGADIAAWISYAVSKRFSRSPERYGKGHPEALVDASAANNAAVGGSWIPALVFGIPGDSVTAIVIGVLYMKGINPGPMVFLQTPQVIYAVFMIFVIAVILMVPLGWVTIKAARGLLSVPRRILLPLILTFCIVGSFALTNSPYGIILMLAIGLLGWVLEDNGFPVAPIILGLVLGGMLERTFLTSMIKSGGAFMGFFDRPVAAVLGCMVLLLWSGVLASSAWKAWARRKARAEAAQ
ncbi:tripartite tricarboxylate transporter permease [Oceanicola sp. D3]|uniref:tripartite tricarboxylate transporter permease n=1 Tax=Oceanicola sp. D3 TaxID=2587163 RepID=UPI001122C494|nr:tripartite tricarboxylate transporter permease [Oceanicola sp. D3]QDC10643.1 tripartite tricarboxylate transporter permease [Oceanicola sp. D3]